MAAASDPQYNRLFHNLNDYYVDMHWRDFQPRFGVAYAFNSKNVFRAGGAAHGAVKHHWGTHHGRHGLF